MRVVGSIFPYVERPRPVGRHFPTVDCRTLSWRFSVQCICTDGRRHAHTQRERERENLRLRMCMCARLNLGDMAACADLVRGARHGPCRARVACVSAGDVHVGCVALGGGAGAT
jgi:hypothetical protein